eukprot:COSAG04_NODE_10_length_43369_cov_4.059025_12_plen_181_part_00
MRQTPAMKLLPLLLAAARLSGRAAAQTCANAAGDATCAALLAGGSDCHVALAGALTVGAVCEKACGVCGTLLEADAEATCFASCADSSVADADGGGNACSYYQGYGCEAGVLAGGATVTSDELKALCPLSCGICSGEHRSTGGYAGGTCPWDATYPFSECCSSSAFTNAAGTSCAGGGKT